MDKDYYLILRVPLDAAPDSIRSAFRELALRYHPDRRGVDEAREFQNISEAYDVLSDPVRRARYDRERHESARQLSAGRDVPRTRDVAPLMAEPIAVTGEPGQIRPSFDALFDRLSRNIFGLEQPKAEHLEPLDFELILPLEEARRGVVIPFEVPVLSTCFQCSGTGRNWVFPCQDCAGEGRIALSRARRLASIEFRDNMGLLRSAVATYAGRESGPKAVAPSQGFLTTRTLSSLKTRG